VGVHNHRRPAADNRPGRCWHQIRASVVLHGASTCFHGAP